MLKFTPLQLYEFDLRGYLCIPNVITPDRISQLNQAIDHLTRYDVAPTIRIDGALEKHEEFRSLLDAIDLSPLFGNGRYRLDHDYVQILRQGKISKALHGGGTPYDASQYYLTRDGKIFCGLVAVAIALNDAPAEYGGFTCLRSSHKASFIPPTGHDGLTEVVGCKAGDAIVFTEALRHTTSPWVGTIERRTLFLKFAPCFVGWSGYSYSFEHPLVKVPSVY